MIRVHRLVAFATGLLLAYVVLTGLGIQLADMRALLAHAPATDPDMLMMRQHINGPPNYAVVSAPDYTATALPADLNLERAIRRAAMIGRTATPGADLRFVEIRQARGRIVGHVSAGGQERIFDLATRTPSPATDLPPGDPPRGFVSPRAWFKALHRFTFLGQSATILNLLAGVGLAALIVTGLAHYFRIYRLRRRSGRSAMLWRGGGGWRTLHRGVAVVAALPVVWITATGLALAADNVGAFVHGELSSPSAGPSAFDGDFSAPLRDADLETMTATTLAAYRHALPATGIRVLRLRWFAGYPQGIVVAADHAASQLVFNTKTGARMAMWERGYPDLGFPSGWEWHQRLKKMHRGDIFGMIGRWLGTIGALCLVYLVISGTLMYIRMVRRRRRAGKSSFVWG